jgi:L-fuconolactonase
VRVDAHHHVWQLARGDYGWLTPKLAPIYRDFALDDLRPLLAAAQIDATVLVQAAPPWPRPIHARCGRAKRRPRAGRRRLDRSRRGRCSGGGRTARAQPVAQVGATDAAGSADPQWILRADVDRALAALPALGLRFDALVTPRELPALAAMIERHPDLRVVIDHGAKPPIASGELEPWANAIASSPGIRRFAARSQGWLPKQHRIGTCRRWRPASRICLHASARSG